MGLQKINMSFSNQFKNDEIIKKVEYKIEPLTNNKVTKKPLFRMLERVKEFRNSCGGCGKKAVIIR